MKVPLCRLEEIPTNGTRTVDFVGREVLVFEESGKPKAILNYCMHLGGPLRRDGCTLVCQWHAAAFDCTRGERLKGPARPDSRLIILPTIAKPERPLAPLHEDSRIPSENRDLINRADREHPVRYCMLTGEASRRAASKAMIAGDPLRPRFSCRYRRGHGSRTDIVGI